ncbi:MAG: prepilin-type N-terminal cleavage/methylation domain-containing protein [Opitutaceae bacterium]|nr:prepilin-type N-terminal cleavage/methylation domain-containing protein [Verrucomicrobiales bacterium]
MRVMLQQNFRRSGFTLMELMVVLVLVAVVSAVTIPAMRGTMEDALLRSASRDMIGAFNIATSRAITSRQTHRIQFDSKTGGYALEKLVRSGSGESDFTPLRGIPGGVGKIDPRIAVEFLKPKDDPQGGVDSDARPAPVDAPTPVLVENVISFYPDGTADACEVHLEDREGFRLGLRINPVTARVRIIELPRK